MKCRLEEKYITEVVPQLKARLGYNNVMHRLIVFGIGNLSVLGMWILIVSAAR